MVRITWLGHACFRVEHDGYSVVFDPFKPGYVPGFKDISEIANAVLCSHAHEDHNYTEAVTIAPFKGKAPFEIKCVQTAHDDAGGEKRGMNTVHILTSKDLVIAHMGDLGHLLTQNQVDEIGRVDVIMIPVGGHYTIDAKQAKSVAETLKAKVIIPMHYRSAQFGFNVIGRLDAFIEQYSNVIRYPDNSLEVDARTPAQVAVLTY